MASIQKRLRRAAGATAVGTALGILRFVPRFLALPVGRFLGRLAFLFARQGRRIAMENLRASFGDTYTEPELRRIVLGVFQHYGCVMVEVARLQRLGKSRLEELVEVRGWEKARGMLDRARARGKGAMIFSAHMGNWELIGAYAGKTWGSEVLTVARRPSGEGYRKLLERFRSQLGMQLVDSDASPREIIKHLAKNGLLGILADQDIKRVNGTFVEFFGRPAYTPTAPANFCHRFGAAIVPVVAVRVGNHYELKVSEPIVWDEETAPEGVDPVDHITQEWSRVIEQWIRETPEQWVWFHQRWRTTPEKLATRRERETA